MIYLKGNPISLYGIPQRENLTHGGVIENAFESWDIAEKCFQPSSCHKEDREN